MITRPRVIAGCTVAAAIVGGTVGGVAAFASSAAPAVHTIRLIATQTGTHQLSRHIAVATEIDRRHGKVVGYDILHEQISKAGGVVSGAVVLKPGLIYFRVPLSNGRVQTGKVTGGAGAFKGVAGTITAKSLNNSGTKDAVVIKYHH
jgi:hypothetical protein